MKWEDPSVTPRRYNSSKWRDEARILRANPGRWALLAEYPDTTSSARTLAWQIKSGRLAAFRPGGSFEATSRQGSVYARFLADHSEHHNDWDMACPKCQQEMAEVLKEEGEEHE